MQSPATPSRRSEQLLRLRPRIEEWRLLGRHSSAGGILALVGEDLTQKGAVALRVGEKSTLAARVYYFPSGDRGAALDRMRDRKRLAQTVRQIFRCDRRLSDGARPF